MKYSFNMGNYHAADTSTSKNANYEYIADIIAAKHLVQGSDTSVNKWIKTFEDIDVLMGDPPSVSAKSLFDTITQIKDQYGVSIAIQIFDAVDPVFDEEMLNAAKYLYSGGALEHLSVLANAGLFMPGVLDYLPKETLQDIINHMKNGGVIDDVFQVQIEIKEEPPDKKQKRTPEMDK